MSPVTVVVPLSEPIQRNETVTITEVTVRKPRSGELRGLNLLDLGQLKVDSLITVIPRVTMPLITEADCIQMAPADLLAIGAEIAGFLLPTPVGTGSPDKSTT